ncbi:hypothetical protein ACQPZJ_47465 [Actinoplanes sp. CA-054009]
MGTTEACRTVGVDRRTGYEWRHVGSRSSRKACARAKQRERRRLHARLGICRGPSGS